MSFAGTLLVLAACGGGLAPVHNVRSAIAAPRGQIHSMQAVRDAIIRSLLARSWQVDREGPDGIVATTHAKGHSATVLIQFDAQSYAISYLDSSPGLKFNGSAIHRRYNEWIERLDKTIRKELTRSEAYPAQQAPADPAQPAPPPAYPAQPAVPHAAEPAPATAPPPSGAPAVAPGAPYEAPPPPPPPPAPAPRR